MNWNWRFPSTTAKHLKLNTSFIIDYKNTREKNIDCFEFHPSPNSGKEWTAGELFDLKQDFWRHWQQGDRRDELESLIRREFLGENRRAATAIETVTGKRVSERTVQAWLIEPTKASSRTCPEWALRALKEYLASPGHKQRLAEAAKFRSEFPLPDDRVREVMDRTQVSLATNAIEMDQKCLDKWRSANFDTLPVELAELEKYTKGYLQYLGKTVFAMEHALKQCESFEDFRRVVLDKVSEASAIEYFVRETRRAIEERSDEFSNDEGLPS